MCAALQIQIIPASSPQATGRVERNHGTHQDRLVTKLRRAGIADDTAANAYLHTQYWAAHNARFAQAPAAPADFPRRCPSARTLDRVFRLETTRTVGTDWVVRYHNRALQLARESGYAPARGTVTVCEWPDGRLANEYRGRMLPWTELIGAPPPRVALPPPLATRPAARPHAAADHPWRQPYTVMRTPTVRPTVTLETLKGTFLSS